MINALPADTRREEQILPGAAQELGVIHHSNPIQLVHGHLDVIRVRAAGQEEGEELNNIQQAFKQNQAKPQ